MSHDVVDDDGIVHNRGLDGQYRPRQGIFGPSRAISSLGGPKIDTDVLGSRKPELGALGTQRLSASGRPLYQSGGQGGGFSDPLVGIFAVCVVIAIILTAGLFLLPFGIGSWLAKRLGRPWSGASLGTVISAVAAGVLLPIAAGPTMDLHEVTLICLSLAVVILGLKIKEAGKVSAYGYDDSPFTVRYIWSWTVFLVPALWSAVCIFSVYAAMNGIADTPRSILQSNEIAAATSLPFALGGYLLGRKIRKAIAMQRWAFGQGDLAPSWSPVVLLLMFAAVVALAGVKAYPTVESWFPKPVGAHAQSVSSPNDQAGSLFRQVFASVSSPATPTPDPEALIAVLNSQWNHDWPGAINTLRRLDQMQPGREWHAKLYAAYVNAANQAADQGNWSQARDYLNHAIVLDPTRPETRAVAARLPAPTHGAAPTGPPSPTPGPMRTAVP